MKLPIIFALALTICSLSILNAVYSKEIKDARYEAVKRGYAYYQTDEYGNSTFTWREEKNE
jgi:hypothetical protein